jgi:ubiquinone/menaquinone biosynthesis C-methylase UbiE
VASEDKKQDKKAEVIVGEGTPKDDWFDDKRGYQVRRTHLELLGLTSLHGQLILDAGCGPGTYGIILAQLGNKISGIEISPDAVQVANERATKKGANFLARVGDLEKLPFKDNSFDICFCGWVLHHFPDMNIAVAELNRVLKPGGKIALAEPNESSTVMRFSRFIEDLPIIRGWVLRAGWDTPNRTIHRHSDYIKVLERHGFTDIKVSSCYPGGLSPLPTRPQKWGLSYLGLLLIHLLFSLRRILFIIAAKVLPRPLNGADLLIVSRKGS